jgi:hypothetical protein
MRSPQKYNVLPLIGPVAGFFGMLPRLLDIAKPDPVVRPERLVGDDLAGLQPLVPTRQEMAERTI